jgi:hypothetical protein
MNLPEGITLRDVLPEERYDYIDVHGVKWPRVTSILKVIDDPPFFKQWKQDNPEQAKEVLQNAYSRGGYIHLAAENYNDPANCPFPTKKEELEAL